MLFTATLTLLAGAVLFILRTKASGGSFPPALNGEEEFDCLQRLEQGDEEARRILIEHNLRLVAHIVKKYYASPADQDDLISIGTIGLIKAINSFRPDKQVRLATYAARCIENEILMHFRTLKKSAGDVSLSDAIDSDPDGNALALMDVISCEDEGLLRVEQEDRYIQLYERIQACLDEREREIICLRYGIGGKEPLTQREIAKTHGISRSYVSRIEKKALQKLRSALEKTE